MLCAKLVFMKFPNFRKYFFANITSVLGYCALAFFIYAQGVEVPPPVFMEGYGESGFYVESDEAVQLSTKGFIIFALAFLSIILLCAEIFIRFLLKKYVSIKPVLCFKLPKFIDITYNFIFLTGFILAFIFIVYLNL